MLCMTAWLAQPLFTILLYSRTGSQYCNELNFWIDMESWGGGGGGVGGDVGLVLTKLIWTITQVLATNY